MYFWICFAIALVIVLLTGFILYVIHHPLILVGIGLGIFSIWWYRKLEGVFK